MKKMLCILAVFCFFGHAFALDVPPLTGHVNDLAGKLTPALKTNLEAQLTAFEEATSNQIVLLIIPSLEGEDDVAFGVKVFKSWRLGQDKKDNGVLWINALKERRNRIEVGYGLEGALPDATCKSILHNEVAPLFKADNFPQGYAVGINAIIAATKGEYKPSATDAKTNDSDAKTNADPRYFLLIFVAIGALLASGINRVCAAFVGCVGAGLIGYWIAGLLVGIILGLGGFFIGLIIRDVLESGGSGSSGGFSSGGGGFFSSGDSGGGFSGGGGSSGGGGASDSY